jgi:hypothetical protein
MRPTAAAHTAASQVQTAGVIRRAAVERGEVADRTRPIAVARRCGAAVGLLLREACGRAESAAVVRVTPASVITGIALRGSQDQLRRCREVIELIKRLEDLKKGKTPPQVTRGPAFV